MVYAHKSVVFFIMILNIPLGKYITSHQGSYVFTPIYLSQCLKTSLTHLSKIYVSGLDSLGKRIGG